MTRIVFLIYLFLIFTWTASISILNPNHLGNLNFWGMVMWVNFLISLNMFASAPILSNFQERDSLKIIGALPAVNLILFLYSLASTLIVLVNYYLPEGSFFFLNNNHLFIQILLFGLTGVTCLFFILSSQGAESGARGLTTRQELIKTITNFQLSNAKKIEESSLEVLFQELLEYIEYKMPHPSSINRNLYLDLCLQIKELSNTNSFDSESLRASLESILLKIKHF